LGDFEIVREIGRGGMGVVYEARQMSLNRKVALKVLSSGLGLTPKAVQRFRREAEAAAKLHHTNIVPVYATGEENGTHFYAMELIHGPSLDHVIRQMRQTKQSATTSGEPGRVSGEPGRVSAGSAPSAASARGADATPLANLEATGPYVGESRSTQALTTSSLSSDSHYFDTVARMIAEVADALEYAHQQGVVHRDMKPSNLLLSPSGRLSVNDFGLARMLEQPGMTMTGEFVGTPAYMSPEQITAGRTPLDHRTDIYSLGATLYELLTLHPPFTGERRDQVLAQIMHKEPKAPREANPKVPVDLETICLKAMEKDPDRRYQTAGAMAEDLRRYVNRFAISARRAGPAERLRKWIRRHPGLAAGMGLALVGIVLAGFFGFQAWSAAAKARQEKLRDTQQKAVHDILMGDLKAAEQVVGDAEGLGAPKAWVQWRRGQIAFHSGEWEEAVRLLEPAAAKMPDNLALNWLLVRVYWLNHQGDKEREIERRIDSLPPSQEEEYLYKGIARMAYTPKECLALFDRAVEERASLIALDARAMCRTRLAFNQSNLDLIKDAMEDAAAAKRIMKDNPEALAMSVIVRHSAAILYEQAEKRRESEDAMRIALGDAETLERFPKVPVAVQIRGIFLAIIGQNEEAVRWYKECMTQKTLARGARNHYAWALYELGRANEAFQVMEALSRGQRDRDPDRALFIAESGESGLERARRICDVMEGEQVADTLFPQPALLFLLGQREKAFQLLAEHRPDADLDSRNALYDRLVNYWKDPTAASEKELLDFAGGSRASQVLAHWHIAIRLIADGNRIAARKHFAKCMTLHYLYFRGYLESRALLARMKNPKWPPWIPAHEP
jgi:serine/threonine protein kinase/tetratricopeptide (TPR) repeat protein